MSVVERKMEDNLVVDEQIEETPQEEQEKEPVSDVLDLEKWLLDITEEKTLEMAQTKVTNALGALETIPNLGMVCLLVGPGGLYNLIFQNSLLESDDGVANVETAMLDVQRQLIQLRRQRGGQQPIQ